MRHSNFGYKLSRTKNERQQLFRNLLRALIIHGKITTTRAKAKAIVPTIEKLITKAKEGSEEKRRAALSVLVDKKVTAQLWEMGKTQFANRQSGFTQIIRLGLRRGDATEEVQLRFVDEAVAMVPVSSSTKVSATPQEKSKKKEVKKETLRKRVQKK